MNWLYAALLVGPALLVGLVTVSPIASGSAAERYYMAEYYQDGDCLGLACFYGRGAEALGLVGPVTASGASAIFQRQHPTTGEPLVENQYRPNHQISKTPRVGIDLVFSAHKSIGVLIGLAPENEAIRIWEQAFLPAVKEALDRYERRYAVCRRGRGGRINESAGIIAMLFPEEVSRANEPFAHCHVILSNAAVREDGTTGALDQRVSFRVQQILGQAFRRALDQRLRSLGYDLEPDKSLDWPCQRVTGVSSSLCDAFSSRRQELLEELSQTGRGVDARARQLAALRTRAPKEHRGRAELRESWARTGARLGFDFEACRSSGLSQKVFDRGLTRTDRRQDDLARAAKSLAGVRHGASKGVHPGHLLASRETKRAARALLGGDGLRMLVGPDRVKALALASRTLAAAGHQVIVVDATKALAERSRREIPADRYVSAGFCLGTAGASLRARLRSNLSLRGLGRALDPWAWSRWGQGHRILHNKPFGSPAPARLDRNAIIVIPNGHHLSAERLGALFAAAEESQSRVWVGFKSPLRRDYHAMAEEVGVTHIGTRRHTPSLSAWSRSR